MITCQSMYVKRLEKNGAFTFLRFSNITVTAVCVSSFVNSQ
jgi:hypothetical protein